MGLLLTGATRAEAMGTFSAAGSVKLCNGLAANFVGSDPVLAGNPSCSDNLTPDAHPDFTTTLDAPSPDYNFGVSASFIPSSFTIAEGTAMPIGTKMAGVSSTTTLGVAGAPCNSTISPQFVLYNGSTDHTDTTTSLSPEGTPNRFLSIAKDTVPPFGMADPDAEAVTKYPTFLNTLFQDTDPRLRLVGMSQLLGGEWVIVQLVLFEPGALRAQSVDPDSTNSPVREWDAGRGYSMIVILQDPSASTSAVNIITDLCTPLASTLMILGRVDADDNGTKDTDVITSPTASETTHIFTVWSQSLRDSDGDGIDNSLDTCPLAANIDGDPRSEDGPDGDMIDSACDPSPNADTPSPTGPCANQARDHDGDCYKNTQDRCPLISDAGLESEGDAAEDNFNAVSPDGGAPADGIGDACDDNDSVAQGDYLQAIRLNAKCIGGTDSDGDGWCDSLDENNSSTAITGANLVDADRDGGFELSAMGSGWTTGEELAIGTDPLFQCPKYVGHDAWPADFDMNRTIDILDIVVLTPPVFGTAGTPRQDIAPDGTIDILDIVRITPPVFGTACSP